ncbi:probable crossover junction endonuclease EME2 isoform X2 [Lagenorhynchus albirostris]|uniref:probable crossover junction endonuclease EME2 isoform X2 n=1 Tax=Lagenorhynchus albirostris TaxID=27610 RepID=UPI0028E6894F|nr:probable crossover junction endonuclease EME2 isoform X2 [Lagenorhynchus albirostris]
MAGQPPRSGRKMPPRAAGRARRRKRRVSPAKASGRCRKGRRGRAGRGEGWVWEGWGLAPGPGIAAAPDLGDTGLGHRGPRGRGGRRQGPRPGGRAQGGGRGGAEAAARASRAAPGAILEDAGADILMEALDALSCECRVEPERPAWSLGWSRVKPDPCSLSVPPEVWAADEQDQLLLLEPEEFLQGVVQLTQTCGPTCSVPWISPESPACLHLAVIGLMFTCGPGASAALGKRGCAVGGLLVGAESACVCLHQGPHPASLQAVPGVWGLFLLHHRVLGSSQEQWQEMALACGGPAGSRSGSSTVSARLWPMLLLLPSLPPAFCNSLRREEQQLTTCKAS